MVKSEFSKSQHMFHQKSTCTPALIDQIPKERIYINLPASSGNLKFPLDLLKGARGYLGII